VGAAAAVDGSTADVADDMHFPSMPAPRGLMDEFIDNGGTIWACGACTKPREITEDHLIPGAAIIAAARVVEEIAAGAQNITFA
jgi:predicted peroxiredoxin